VCKLFEAFDREFGVTIDYQAAETLSESIFAPIVHEVQEIPQVASIAARGSPESCVQAFGDERPGVPCRPLMRFTFS
jgi:hypothetical protein